MTARSNLRTALTVLVVVLGLALVTFTAALRVSFALAAGSDLPGQLVVRDTDARPLPASLARALSAVDGVRAISAASTSPSRLVRTRQRVRITGIDPETINDVLKLDWIAGSPATIASLSGEQVAVEKAWADDHHVRSGGTFEVIAPNGVRLTVTVRGVFQDKANVLTEVTIPKQTLALLLGRQQDALLIASVVPGTDVNAVRRRAERELQRRYPGVEVLARQGFADRTTDQADRHSLLFVGLLALTAGVSLLGIVTTRASRSRP